jgi:very-short-patch-repair endonuclease
MPPKAKEYDWNYMQELHDSGMCNRRIADAMEIPYNAVRRAFRIGLVLKTREYVHRHDEETKKKISQKRKKYLKENPDKHVWKRNEKFKSDPCNKLKDALKENNINFVEEYQPIEDRFYSVDIAFPHIKLAIEINGNQHYNRDGSLKEYYQQRHNLIESQGWEVREYHYASVYNEEWLNTIITKLSNNEPLLDSDKVIFEKKEQRKYYCACGGEMTSRAKSCRKCMGKIMRKVERPPYEKLKQEIEETSYVAVGKNYGVSDNAVRKWVKFYENNI